MITEFHIPLITPGIIYPSFLGAGIMGKDYKLLVAISIVYGIILFIIYIFRNKIICKHAQKKEVQKALNTSKQKNKLKKIRTYPWIGTVFTVIYAANWISNLQFLIKALDTKHY